MQIIDKQRWGLYRPRTRQAARRLTTTASHEHSRMMMTFVDEGGVGDSKY